MGRPKKNPDYNPERARDELVRVVSDFYLNPPSEDATGKDGKTRMKSMELEFGLSMGKIRKLLVTGGVYSFEKDGVELVSEIARLREEGLSDNEIMEKLSIKKSLLNALTPYQRGTYNADFTADGYDISNVSTEARRKRNQRKRDKMKETNVVEDHEKEIEEAKRQMDEKKYPGMTPEQIEEEKARRRAENEARHQANLERKRKYRERRAMEEENDPGDYLRLAERFKDSMPEYAEEMRRRHEIEMRKKNGERFSPEQVEAYVRQEKKQKDPLSALEELIAESEKKSAYLHDEYEKMKAKEELERSGIEKIDEYTYAQAIDHDAYNHMSEEDKKVNEELRRRMLELMAEEEEIVLPEIDEQTFGNLWESDKTVKGRPIGDFLFLPDTSHKYILPSGEMVEVNEGGAFGVFDAYHEKHIFVLQIWGPTVSYIFKAVEAKKILKNGKVMAGQPDTNYEFTVLGELDDREECFARLVDKTVISLQNLTIERSGRAEIGFDSPRQCLSDKYVLNAKETGHAMIEWSAEHDNITFQVDGQTFSPEDAMKLFSPYEGFELQFAIRDCTDTDAFTNDTVLYPVEMNREAFVDELTKILLAVSKNHDGKFIEKDSVPYLDVLIEDLLKKLNFYYCNEDNVEAKKIAESLIGILKGVGTDSPVFPEYEIRMIRDAARFPWEEDEGRKESREKMEEFEKALSMAKEMEKILIVEGKVDFDTSDAIVIDCAKSKVREVKGYTVFTNAEKCSRDELTLIRQSWDDNRHPVVIWSNKSLGDKVDGSLKWRALYFKGE